MRRVLIACAVAALALPAGADPGERVSTLADQRSVSVTIYNAGIALVRDDRRVTLPRGTSRLALRDVSANIEPETALFRSITSPDAIDILEQNFNFDLLSPETLLKAYVGRTVTVVHTNPKTGEHTRESARVLATNGGVVLQYADRIETEVDGTIAFPTIPGTLRDRPTFTIDVDNEAAGPQDVELTYITNGLGWRADYVGELSADGTSLDLDGSVTLTNQSGTTYPNANLLLVAGALNIKASAPLMETENRQVIGRTMARAVPAVSDIGDFHLYTMPRRTTIADRQTKQVALLGAHKIKSSKTLELRGNEGYYQTADPDLGDRLPIQSFLTFANEGGDLGVPLPAGIVRIYQRDVHGNNEFVGSDAIQHTPRGETVRLFLGDSFDVTARKKQTDFHIIDNVTFESSYEIVIHNAKASPVTVLVVEPIPGDWSIKQENLPHVKSSSSTANWTLIVPPNGATTLTYTAHVFI